MIGPIKPALQLEVTEPKLRPVGSKESGGPRDAPVRARDPARV